ncbi:hypothetical protein [Simonsiella muelleri]|uniref:hypothetical protein n=1 Tax=Simonsiella muelleri TaxID=72 RepID=UPI0003188C39|nr:hypothetical protein [Simonsiella muelleri]
MIIEFDGFDYDSSHQIVNSTFSGCLKKHRMHSEFVPFSRKYQSNEIVSTR